jgi:SAM-dependent methyltransferase
MSEPRGFFDIVAAEYGERWTIEEEVRRGAAALGAMSGPGPRVLEVGCGNGRMLTELPRGAIGMDGSHEMLRETRRRVSGARLVRAAAERLPFRAGSFDRVVCVNTIHTCSRPGDVLDEILRLRPNTLVVDARNAMHPLVWIRHRVRRARLRVPYTPLRPGVWTETLRRHGWRVIARRGVGRPLTDSGEGFRFRHLLGAIISRLPGLAPCYIFDAVPGDGRTEERSRG